MEWYNYLTGLLDHNKIAFELPPAMQKSNSNSKTDKVSKKSPSKSETVKSQNEKRNRRLLKREEKNVA